MKLKNMLVATGLIAFSLFGWASGVSASSYQEGVIICEYDNTPDLNPLHADEKIGYQLRWTDLKQLVKDYTEKKQPITLMGTIDQIRGTLAEIEEALKDTALAQEDRDFFKKALQNTSEIIFKISKDTELTENDIKEINRILNNVVEHKNLDYTPININVDGVLTFAPGTYDFTAEYDISAPSIILPAGSDKNSFFGLAKDNIELDKVIVASASTPAPSSSGSGHHYSAPSPATPRGCGDTTPAGQADLFQITRNGSSATLYFSPVKDNTNRYHIVFGYKEGQELFGQLSAETTNESQTGVQVITINHLDPKQAYSFQIMPVNGCAVGERSNWLTTHKTGISYRYN